MKNVAVLITHQALIAAIGNTRYMFTMVNRFLKQTGKDELFNVSLVGLSKTVELDQGLYTIKADAKLDEVKQIDLIIIPPMSGDMEKGISLNRAYIPWILQQYQRGAEVASLCVGAFILAETGLLKGRECSTHWQTANEFKKRYPDVQLVEDKIVTDYKGLYTSGGANSYWNLLVYLVEKFTDREIAISTSKYFEVELGRDNQYEFMTFEGCRLHQDEAIMEVQHYIEMHYQDRITIDQLARMTHLGRRTFQRRFKNATHNTVREYIRKVKAEAAKKLLESQRFTVNEVMFEVGYNDPKAFRDVFKKVIGMTPLEYRNKFS
ncbi:helix-turn-helix domain-containing protein [Rapidithrix thailandica]|uniref:Helix-turn-helix domain-containing protein n=1 Tax=Rapidithrix thailandica TaxID=413964 RepID=A0AAW9RRP9_9BACT